MEVNKITSNKVNTRYLTVKKESTTAVSSANIDRSDALMKELNIMANRNNISFKGSFDLWPLLQS